MASRCLRQSRYIWEQGQNLYIGEADIGGVRQQSGFSATRALQSTHKPKILIYVDSRSQCTHPRTSNDNGQNARYGLPVERRLWWTISRIESVAFLKNGQAEIPFGHVQWCVRVYCKRCEHLVGFTMTPNLSIYYHGLTWTLVITATAKLGWIRPGASTQWN